MQPLHSYLYEHYMPYMTLTQRLQMRGAGVSSLHPRSDPTQLLILLVVVKTMRGEGGGRKMCCKDDVGAIQGTMPIPISACVGLERRYVMKELRNVLGACRELLQ